jgi:hypothetical protein
MNLSNILFFPAVWGFVPFVRKRAVHRAMSINSKSSWQPFHEPWSSRWENSEFDTETDKAEQTLLGINDDFIRDNIEDHLVSVEDKKNLLFQHQPNPEKVLWLKTWNVDYKHITKLYKDCMSNIHCEVAAGDGSEPFLEVNLDLLNHGVVGLADRSDTSVRTYDIMIHQAADSQNVHLRTHPTSINVMNPSSIPINLIHAYKSVAATFLMHRLDGKNMFEKGPAFETCAHLLARKEDGGEYFFGVTLLGKDLMDANLKSNTEVESEKKDKIRNAASSLHEYNRWVSVTV